MKAVVVDEEVLHRGEVILSRGTVHMENGSGGWDVLPASFLLRLRQGDEPVEGRSRLLGECAVLSMTEARALAVVLLEFAR